MGARFAPTGNSNCINQAFNLSQFPLIKVVTSNWFLPKLLPEQDMANKTNVLHLIWLKYCEGLEFFRIPKVKQYHVIKNKPCEVKHKK